MRQVSQRRVEKSKPRKQGKASVVSNKKRSGFVNRFVSGFHHHQEVAVESLSRLLNETSATVLTWAVIGIALALPLCLLLLVQNLQQFGAGFESSARISMFMVPETAETRLLEMATELEGREAIASVQVITAAEALEEFESASGFGEVLRGLDENPLPPVLVVTPESTVAEDVESLLSDLQALPEVDTALLDLQWLQRLSAILGIARRAGVWLTLLLCVGVILVIGNTVRLAIENRRNEILVVKLVGGTDAYVSRPFLYTGFWYGAGGGLVAWFLLQFSLWALRGPVTDLAGLYESGFALQGVDIFATLLIFTGSGLLGWAGAWLSVVRHLRAIEPR